jgi:deaminated glutathione amidase
MATTGMRRGQMPWARREAIGYSRGMSRTLAIAVVQNRAAADFAVNLDRCLSFAAEAVRDGAKFVALPEYFSGLRADGPRIHPVAFRESEHPAIPAFAELARRNGAIVLLGSLGVLAADGRIFNRSYLIDAQGKIAARYDKLHLFDIDMPDGTPVRESQTIAPGADAVLARLADAAIGLSICYDLRFPLLYRKLAQAGAEILSVPAAFTKVTGEAHWHVLNRARAIENGCFVVAPCQWGELPGGARSFGHSLIVDPWGRVLVDGGEGEGVFTATVDLDDVASTRAKIPSLQHDRNFTLAG